MQQIESGPFVPRRFICDDLFTEVDGTLRLVGSRCAGCGAIMFPVQSSCSRCMSIEIIEHPLGVRGALWSWTVQRFAPKSPPYAVADRDAFAPFGLGYVELAGELRLQTRLTEADPTRLRIGMPMELTLVPAPGGEDSGAVTYAFRPVGETVG